MREPDEAADRSTAALAERLRQSVGSFVRAIRRDAGTDKSAQAEALDLLDRQGSINIAELARARGVKHQSMQLVVSQLEATGHVRCGPNPADRRSRLVALTEAGMARVRAGRQARARRIEDALRTVLSEEERDILRVSIDLLDRLSATATPRSGLTPS